MNNRRRQRGEFHHRDNQGPRSQYRKPPHGSWQPTIPSWEKQFCYSVGSVPWQKLLEAKRFMYLYENIVQWNDSAGEEAFNNAKNRFWAEINGLPCNISLPDPDIYIDEIDWNANIDQELVLDLEREPKDLDPRNKGEEVVILSSSLLLNQSFSCTGWGDAEEDFQKAANNALDTGYENCDQNASNYANPWESNDNEACRPSEENGWGDYSSGWKNNCNENDGKYNGWKKADNRTEGAWETWDGDNRKRDGAGWYMSRYKTSRFHGDGYHMDRGWWRRERGRKRVNFVY